VRRGLTFNRRVGQKHDAEPDEATAFPVRYQGKGPYAKSFADEYGVVFEDDGETGYFYATDGEHTQIFDALHLYDRGDSDSLQPGEEAFVVWNPSRKRAGLYYRNEFHAVFDFSARRGVCRTGFPPALSSSDWSQSGHRWDDSFVSGLEP
jgi:hypothetical protein